MTNRFATAPTITGGALASFAVTPSATALSEPIRAVTIGTSGVIHWTSSIDGTNQVTGTLPVGSYPLFASHILAATTAGDITGWV